MTLTKYIAELQGLLERHGDLEVTTYSTYSGTSDALQPTLRYRKILRGRERTPTYWHHRDGEDRKGEAVIEV